MSPPRHCSSVRSANGLDQDSSDVSDVQLERRDRGETVRVVVTDVADADRGGQRALELNVRGPTAADGNEVFETAGEGLTDLLLPSPLSIDLESFGASGLGGCNRSSEDSRTACFCLYSDRDRPRPLLCSCVVEPLGFRGMLKRPPIREREMLRCGPSEWSLIMLRMLSRPEFRRIGGGLGRGLGRGRLMHGEPFGDGLDDESESESGDIVIWTRRVRRSVQNAL